MAQQLKRWESPRRQGRNIKGKGGAARTRQLKKQQKQLRRKLKKQNPKDNSHKQELFTQGKENLLKIGFNTPPLVADVRELD